MSSGDLGHEILMHLVDGVGVLPQLRVELLATIALFWRFVVPRVDLIEYNLFER